MAESADGGIAMEHHSQEQRPAGLTGRLIAACVCLGMIYAAVADTTALLLAGGLIVTGAGLLIFGLTRRQRIAS